MEGGKESTAIKKKVCRYREGVHAGYVRRMCTEQRGRGANIPQLAARLMGMLGSTHETKHDEAWQERIHAVLHQEGALSIK